MNYLPPNFIPELLKPSQNLRLIRASTLLAPPPKARENQN